MTFEVVSYCPALTIKRKVSPPAYWITPVDRQYSAVCFYEDELVAVDSNEDVVPLDDLELLELPDEV